MPCEVTPLTNFLLLSRFEAGRFQTRKTHKTTWTLQSIRQSCWWLSDTFWSGVLKDFTELRFLFVQISIICYHPVHARYFLFAYRRYVIHTQVDFKEIIIYSPQSPGNRKCSLRHKIGRNQATFIIYFGRNHHPLYLR